MSSGPRGEIHHETYHSLCPLDMTCTVYVAAQRPMNMSGPATHMGRASPAVSLPYPNVRELL